MFTMKNGTHSAMQSTSASVTAVEISIAQLLPVLSNFTSRLHMQAVVLAASSSWATAGMNSETTEAAEAGRAALRAVWSTDAAGPEYR
jgi:hypothetical protein